MKTKFRRYEYPMKTTDGTKYHGSYTIKEGIEPLNFKDEQLVQEFEAEVK